MVALETELKIVRRAIAEHNQQTIRWRNWSRVTVDGSKIRHRNVDGGMGIKIKIGHADQSEMFLYVLHPNKRSTISKIPKYEGEKKLQSALN